MTTLTFSTHYTHDKDIHTFLIISNKKNSTEKGLLKAWLDQLQQESWQLELLISGLALLGVFTSRPYLHNFSLLLTSQGDGTIDAINVAYLFVARPGWYLFVIILLLHIVLRGLWIGVIGLRYVSKDIDYDALNYGAKMDSYVRRTVGDYDDYIERLEKLCSVLFAAAFLFFFLLISFVMYVIPLGLLIALTGQHESYDVALTILIIIYLVIGLLVFIDFITAGLLRRSKTKLIAAIYLPLYRFIGVITLSFLYRPLLYNFLDHRYTKTIFYVILPLFLALALEPAIRYNGTPYIPNSRENSSNVILINNYIDQLNAKPLVEKTRYPVLSFASMYIDHNYPQLFIPITSRDQELVAQLYKLPPLREAGLKIGWHDHEDEKVLMLQGKESDLYYKITDADADLLRDSAEIWKGQLQATKEKLKTRKETLEKTVLVSLRKHNRVYVDGVRQEEQLSCKYCQLPRSYQQGLICFLDIQGLTPGPHELILQKDKLIVDTVLTHDETVIQFIRK